uniref:Uncharacterized protein n=1 Tax=Sphaerodactylus townsendi TaxID=933632 RepID=A0ACB8FGQ8_9SAUR
MCGMGSCTLEITSKVQSLTHAVTDLNWGVQSSYSPFEDHHIARFVLGVVWIAGQFKPKWACSECLGPGEIDFEEALR